MRGSIALQSSRNHIPHIVNYKIIFLCIWKIGGSGGKESACNAGDPGLIPALGRSSEERNDYPLQYSWLENSMDRGPRELQSMGSQRVGHNWATFSIDIISNVHLKINFNFKYHNHCIFHDSHISVYITF